MWKLRNKIMNKSYYAFFMGLSFNSTLYGVLKPNYSYAVIMSLFFIFARVMHSICKE